MDTIFRLSTAKSTPHRFHTIACTTYALHHCSDSACHTSHAGCYSMACHDVQGRRAACFHAQARRGAYLQGAAVAHHRLDGKRGLGPRKALDTAFAALNDRHCCLTPCKLSVDVQHARGFRCRFRCGGMCCVALLPQEFQRPTPQRHVARRSTVAGLIAHVPSACVDPRGQPLPHTCPVQCSLSMYIVIVVHHPSVVAMPSSIQTARDLGAPGI